MKKSTRLKMQKVEMQTPPIHQAFFRKTPH